MKETNGIMRDNISVSAYIIIRKGLLFLLFLFAGIHIHATDYFIDLTKITPTSIKMKDVFLDVRCIELEYSLNEKGHMGSLFITSDYQTIIVANIIEGEVSLFNSESGEFIKKVDFPIDQNSHTILGPSPCFGFYDEKEGLFYRDEIWNNRWIGIDIYSNKMIEEINKPSGYGLANFKRLENDLYVSYANNLSGKDPCLLVFINKEGKITSFVPNNNYYLKNSMDNPHFSANFYTYNDKVFFHESFYGDTIYEVGNGSITPHIVFEMGDKKPNYRFRDMPGGNDNNYQILGVYETNKAIYFGYDFEKKGYWGYFNKESNETFVTCLEKNKLEATDLNEILTFFPVLHGDGQLKIRELKKEVSDESENKMNAIIYWLK